MTKKLNENETKGFRQTVTLRKYGRTLGRPYVVELDCSYSELPCHWRTYRSYGHAKRYALKLVNEGGYNFRNEVEA